YFFDIKATKGNDLYLTITESKKRFNKDEGKPFFEKHKIFLYKEDFEKFVEGLQLTIDKIKELRENDEAYAQKYQEDLEKKRQAEEEGSGERDEGEGYEGEARERDELSEDSGQYTDVSFEDLGSSEEKDDEER
ncbi:MAG: DUF3276 family protein, partial [Flavobacteriales bacterium]